jgi:radical SAM protein with 4Fe4S-binding SPASM domain
VTECSIQREGFDILLGRLNKQAEARKIRLAYLGTIEMTPYCNLKCRHCYVTQSKMEGHLLSSAELHRIIDEIAAEGCLWLLLTGGEPMLREDFLDIYTHSKKKGILTTVFTNGTLITPEIARYLHDLPPEKLEISIYGATQATYESVTGVPGSYERMMRGIDLLVEHDVDFELKTMLITLNKHEYWDMKKIAKDLGVKFRMDPILNPALDGSRQPCEFRLTPEEIIEIDTDDPERHADFEQWVAHFDGPPKVHDTIYTCGSGMGKFHIDGFGKLQMCTIAREPGYDLRQGSFREGWQEFLPEIRSRKITRPSLCRTCEYRNTCHICPGWAQLELGTLEEQPIEYLCEIARLRATRFAKKEVATKDGGHK